MRGGNSSFKEKLYEEHLSRVTEPGEGGLCKLSRGKIAPKIIYKQTKQAI